MVHATGGIRTHNPKQQTAAYLRLSPRGHQNQQKKCLRSWFVSATGRKLHATVQLTFGILFLKLVHCTYQSIACVGVRRPLFVSSRLNYELECRGRVTVQGLAHKVPPRAQNTPVRQLFYIVQRQKKLTNSLQSDVISLYFSNQKTFQIRLKVVGLKFDLYFVPCTDF
jgi:hypothetical protein